MDFDIVRQSARVVPLRTANERLQTLEPIFTQAANTKAIAAGGQTIDPQA
jgi:hypothetical protein